MSRKLFELAKALTEIDFDGQVDVQPVRPGLVKIFVSGSPMVLDSRVVQDDDVRIIRSSQPCWCPDGFLEASMFVSFCPKHGSFPDPDLWNHDAEPHPADG